MDDAREAELIFELAERHAMTAAEIVRMARFLALGPLADRMTQECGIYEPGADERVFAIHVARRIAQGAPISELLDLRRQCVDILRWLCEREPDLAKRAAKFTALRELEQEMEAIREKARKEIERRGLGKIGVLEKR
jgi:hypothetical protein